MTRSIGIIGTGAIANHLRDTLERKGYSVVCQIGRTTIIRGRKELPREGRGLPEILDSLGTQPEIMCLAISTKDKGEAALEYMLTCLKRGIYVITCEKGAWAHHAGALRPFRDLLRCSASVGGGTQMLPYLRSRHPDPAHVEIEAVLNGTLNFIFHELSCGDMTLGEACAGAQRRGYAESGASDPLSLINGELRDVLMKTCVLFNTVLAKGDEYITPDSLGARSLTADSLSELARQASTLRMVVSFSGKPSKSHSYFGHGFGTEMSGWEIRGGFRFVKEEPGRRAWLPDGRYNALRIIEKGTFEEDGQFLLDGPGAGIEATTKAMLDDLLSIPLVIRQ